MASAGELENHLEDMRAMVNSKSIERFQHRLEDIRNAFPRIQIKNGRSSPLAIGKAEDVILFKQEDFNYPFDASWFELMQIRSILGLGRPRLDAMARELSERGFSNPLARMYSTMTDRIGRDIRENLLPIIPEIDPRMMSQVVIKNEFIESVAGIIADYIIDASIQDFNYAVGFTDMASGTTIQLRAIKTIFLQMQSSCLLPLTTKQLEFLTDVMTHAIKSGTGK